MHIAFVYKAFSFRKHFGTVLTEEIRTAKFGTGVFVMPKRLITKLNIHDGSTPCDCFISRILQNYCDMVKFLFLPSLRKRGFTF